MLSRANLAIAERLKAPRPRQTVCRRARAWLRQLHAAYKQERDIRRIVNHMQRLDDRLLRDMGLERGSIDDWARLACSESASTPSQKMAQR
mgnify:CR=1 FL=1